MAFKCTILAVFAIAAVSAASIIPNAEGTVGATGEAQGVPTSKEPVATNLGDSVKEGDLEVEGTERDIEWGDEDSSVEDFDGDMEKDEGEDLVDGAERVLEDEAEDGFGDEDNEGLENDGEFDLSESAERAFADEDELDEDGSLEEGGDLEMEAEVRDQDTGGDDDLLESLDDEIEGETEGDLPEGDLDVAARSEEEDDGLVITNVEHISGEENEGVPEDFTEDFFAENMDDVKAGDINAGAEVGANEQ